MENQPIVARLQDNINRVIVGKEQSIKLCLAALISRGHILIEDVPGLGKTVLARTLAASITASFRRIQFTPDLLPSDITGVSIFNQKTQEFEPRPGPIFANIILADEINRSTPRTQSGLLECMQDRSVTFDGTTHELPEVFFVIATQNPVEFHGTYPLPEAQLDRFLMQIDMGYPSAAEELRILERQRTGSPLDTLAGVCSVDDIRRVQEQVTTVYLSPDLLRYITEIVGRTRTHPSVALGASPRGSLALMQISRATALLDARDFVVPDDIKTVAPYVLSHRIVLKPDAVMNGTVPKTVIRQILNEIVVPL